jgi:hypothetical protein
MVAELYDALRKAGVDEQLSKEAARAVLPSDVLLDLATKADLAELKAELKGDLTELKASMSELKVELIKWNVGAMAVLTAIFAAISRLG